VLQYNKRDLNFICPVEELERNLNPRGLPHFEAVATKGTGVFDTLKCISKLVLDQAKRKQLFPERDVKVTEAPKAPVEVDLSQVPGVEQVAAAVDADTPPQPSRSVETSVVTAVLEQAESEEEVDQPELTGGGGADGEAQVQNQDTASDNSTIISWSAGRSHRKDRSKGFFLLRWLGKLFK
jgi:hypothetical protein